MGLINLKVFSQYIKEATIETVAQEIDKFNSASRGAIILSATGFDGDYLQETMFASLHTAQRRVDRYGTNDTQASTALSEIQKNSVKVGGGFGPILWEPAQFAWMQQNEAAAIEAISRNLAEAILKDQLNTGIASAVAAIANVAGLVNDVSSSANISYSAINGAHAKMGDRSSAILIDIMDGIAYHKLIGDNITNANRLFTAGNVTIVEGVLRPIVVTDAPALFVSGTPDKSKILSLVSGGIAISDAGSLVTNIEQSNGKKRIETTMQADYDFGVGIKGFAWDTVNGGKSPTDAELATGTNWDMYVSSVKDTAGVLTIGDATA